MKITKYIFSIIIIFTVIISAFACESEKNVSKSTEIVDVRPTVSSETKKPQNTETGDPIIVFHDPYFEKTVREIAGKSVGDIKVSEVSGITSIIARVKGIRSLEDIVWFTSLESLDIYGNKICDLSPLAKLTKLKNLCIDNNYNALLDGSNSKSGMNLQPLSNLPLLEILSANGNYITDISAIKTNVSLINISFHDNMISDISAVSSLVNLEEIDFSNNRITKTDALKNCAKLVSVNLSNNYFESKEGSDIVIYNGITDISCFANSSELTYINISMNMINSLEPLSGLLKLKKVYADDNKITDLSCFSGNSSIQTLSIKRNSVIDMSFRLTMTGLIEFSSEGNPGS